MNLKSTILFFSMALFATMVALAGSREVTLLDEDWKFQKGERGSEQDLSFDDSRWQSVQVPHDWAALGPFDLNEDIQFVQVIEDGDKEAKLRTGRTGALPATGTGWYRKHLSLPGSLASKKIYLEFDGAMSHARVYLNGTFVGEWPYGYSSFSFDITPYVRLGKDNILAVRLENKPEMSRFYSGAGIYRPVRLVCVEPAHVVHWGTCITTPEVSAKQGKAQIKTTVNTPDAATGKIKLVTEIWDQKGKKVATASQEKPAGGQVLFDQLCTVKQPALWDTETPNLYKAVSNVYVNNTLSDTYETTFGFRTIRFDKDKGFFLNGKSMKFKGVCLHHDLGPLGAAVSLRATERQIEIMKEMGCNAIRTSHNPPSVELLDLCDRMGILVQVEAFDEWKSGKCVNGYNTLFDQWAEKDLIAMIHRDRNHPSVVMWSIGNEIREQGMRDGAKVAQFLTDIAHREDPTRPTTAGFNNHGSAVNNGLAAAVDLVGFNYKYFDYEKYHKSHPEFVLYGSETSSTVSSRGIYKFPLKDNKNPWHEDYQVSSYDYEYVPWGSVPDSEFAEQDDHEYLLGEFVWTGFDYLGEPTPYGQGSPSRRSYFGIVDLDA